MPQLPIAEAFASVHQLIINLRDSDDAVSRAKLAKTASRELDKLETRLNPVERGRKGGEVTATRGSDYFRELASKRKTRAGGRPKKQD